MLQFAHLSEGSIYKVSHEILKQNYILHIGHNHFLGIESIKILLSESSSDIMVDKR